jgi:hypothetical protein
VTGIAIDETSIYWTTWNAPGQVLKLAKAQFATPDAGSDATAASPEGGPVPLVALAYTFGPPVTDSRFMYFSDYFNGGSIRAVPLDAGAQPSSAGWPPDNGEAFTLVPERSSPGPIALDGTSIYWTEGYYPPLPDGGGEVMKASLDGGGVTTLASGRSAPGSIATDGARVYFLEPTDVAAVPIDGGPATVLAHLSGSPNRGIVATPAGVYWAEVEDGGSPSRLMRVGLDGGAATVVASTVQPTSSTVVADGVNVYWGSSVGLLAVPLAGGAPTTLYSGPGGASELGALATDSTNVYVYDQALQVMQKIAPDGGVSGGWPFDPSSLAATTTALYGTSGFSIERLNQ